MFFHSLHALQNITFLNFSEQKNRRISGIQDTLKNCCDSFYQNDRFYRNYRPLWNQLIQFLNTFIAKIYKSMKSQKIPETPENNTPLNEDIWFYKIIFRSVHSVLLGTFFFNFVKSIFAVFTANSLGTFTLVKVKKYTRNYLREFQALNWMTSRVISPICSYLKLGPSEACSPR